MAKGNHKPVPRYRSYDGPTIFTHGFRPFFLLAGLWAPIVLVLSLGQILGSLTLPSGLDAVSWHFHELLFGYVSAALAGFLLTAVPNWTDRLPLQGAPLIVLVLVWVAGRLAVATSEIIGMWPAAFIDLAFLTLLAGVTLREIIAGRNWRNLPIVAAIIVWLISNMFFYGGQLGFLADEKLSWRLAIAVVVMLISLVGGRIIPSFTSNWLVKRGVEVLPAPFGKYDKVTLAVTLV
ncbi:MAG: NnrS family protein, partial [Hyphomicrobiales bacterium]